MLIVAKKKKLPPKATKDKSAVIHREKVAKVPVSPTKNVTKRSKSDRKSPKTIHSGEKKITSPEKAVSSPKKQSKAVSRKPTLRKEVGDVVSEEKVLQAEKNDSEQIDSDLMAYGLFLQQLHLDWEPHSGGQKEVLEDLLVNKKRIVFLNCGRKFGKTEIAMYYLWRKAAEIPNSVWFYVCPTAELGKKVVWDTKRLQTFGPRNYLLDGKQGIKESTQSIHFKNGSGIYIVGSNVDTDSLLGVMPHGAVYDEFRAFSPRFHESMRANFLPHKAAVLIISTPPSKEDILSGKCAFYAKMIKICKVTDRYSYYHRTSLDNPHMDKEDLEFEKQELYANGEEHVWHRENMAEIVFGSQHSMYPELTESSLTPHLDLKRMLTKQETELDWFVVVDPSGAKRWGVLFAAVNPYDRMVYLVDCITLDSLIPSQRNEMSALVLWSKIENICRELNPHIDPDQWHIVYDSAESFFYNELRINVGEHLNIYPVNKNKMSKTEGFSRIKDLISTKSLYISDRVLMLISELRGMKINPVTELPKKEFDELIDCLRYLIYEVNYIFLEEYKKKAVMRKDYSDAEIVFESGKMAMRQRAEAEKDIPEGFIDMEIDDIWI